MKAQNLTVCVPYKGCDKNCPYCVSRMTGYLHPDLKLFRQNIPKVKKLAEAAQVSSVLLTGKGEPTMDMLALEDLAKAFCDWPLELQTNGINLLSFAKKKDPLELRVLRNIGLNVVALSFDRLNQFGAAVRLFDVLRRLGFVRRVTLNITNKIPRYKGKERKLFERILKLAKEFGVQQLSFRQVTVPNGVMIAKKLYVTSSGQERQAREARKWIETNVDYDHYYGLVEAAKKVAIQRGGHRVRELPYGAEVWDIDGIAVTWFDYCVQDEHRAHDVRSLIYQEDGHLYTAWNSPASILF